ncbi:MAG: hypothetical protein V1645_03505 [archaeon]
MELSEIVADLESFMKSSKLPIYEIHLRVFDKEKHDLDILTSYIKLERYAKEKHLKLDVEYWINSTKVPCVCIERDSYNLRLFGYKYRISKGRIIPSFPQQD